MICKRLEQHFERGAKGLSYNHYGFRRGRSTVDAINKLTTIAGNEIVRTRWMHASKEYCALDVENAFNSACCSVKTSAHLVRIISSYFSGRLLLYDTDEGVKIYEITDGALC